MLSVMLELLLTSVERQGKEKKALLGILKWATFVLLLRYKGRLFPLRLKIHFEFQ